MLRMVASRDNRLARDRSRKVPKHSNIRFSPSPLLFDLSYHYESSAVFLNTSGNRVASEVTLYSDRKPSIQIKRYRYDRYIVSQTPASVLGA